MSLNSYLSSLPLPTSPFHFSLFSPILLIFASPSLLPPFPFLSFPNYLRFPFPILPFPTRFLSCLNSHLSSLPLPPSPHFPFLLSLLSFPFSIPFLLPIFFLTFFNVRALSSQLRTILNNLISWKLLHFLSENIEHKTGVDLFRE